MLLAIDPGYKNIGYCVGDLTQLKVVSSGTIVTTGKTFPDQLYELKNKLESLIIPYNVSKLVYEKPTYAVGHSNGTKVQQAIGVLLCLTSQYSFTEIIEYAPSEIKKILTKSGKADKLDIQKAVLNYLPNIVFKTDHESDAIGMYICYLNNVNTVFRS